MNAKGRRKAKRCVPRINRDCRLYGGEHDGHMVVVTPGQRYVSRAGFADGVRLWFRYRVVRPKTGQAQGWFCGTRPAPQFAKGGIVDGHWSHSLGVSMDEAAEGFATLGKAMAKAGASIKRLRDEP